MKSHKLIIIGLVLVAVFALSADARVVRDDILSQLLGDSDLVSPER